MKDAYLTAGEASEFRDLAKTKYGWTVNDVRGGDVEDVEAYWKGMRRKPWMYPADDMKDKFKVIWQDHLDTEMTDLLAQVTAGRSMTTAVQPSPTDQPPKDMLAGGGP